jgi:hypothetical protein
MQTQTAVEQFILPKKNSSYITGGMQWRSWLRQCTTSWKVVGSNADGVTGIFHSHNSSSCTMALGLTQPLTGIFPGGKGSQCVVLTTLPPSCADCLEIWEPQPPGTLWPCQVCNGITLPLLYHI